MPTFPQCPPVRLLGPADLARCVALSMDRGWSPERAKWSMLLAVSEVFGIDAPDGHGLAGAVVLTRWAADYASVGMMLVAARYERRGLGRALMQHLLHAAGDDAVVTLFATDMGRPLYEKLGFELVRRNVSFIGRFRAGRSGGSGRPGGAGRPGGERAGGGPDGAVRAATGEDLAAILALDRATFGADRGHVLTRLSALADDMAVLEPAPAGGGIDGYAVAWRNDPGSTVIGPLVAPDPGAAARLVTELAAHAQTPVRLDLDPDRPELPAWAHARGLEPAGRTVVMARGALAPRGAPERLFTPVSVALA